MTNTNILRGKIVSSGITQGQLAQKLFISNTALHNKIHNKAPFTAEEIFKIKKILGINVEDMEHIFFGV